MKPTSLDKTLEAATSDCFWVPPHVQVVERAAIKYSHSPQPSVGYNRVVHVRPAVEPPEELVEEVIGAHQGGWSRWRSKEVPQQRGAGLPTAEMQALPPSHAFYLRRGQTAPSRNYNLRVDILEFSG
ncbi:MAG: hypothetical protein ACLFVJ_21905 [Persicimonas sp.]